MSDPTEAAPTVSTASKDYEGIDYAEFWSGPEKAHIDRLEQRLISRFLPGGQTFAEIGSGYGRLAPCYLDRYATANMVEPASNLRRLAEKEFTSAVHIDANVYDLPFDEASLDGLLMVRVMHHLTEPRKALAELHRVLRPGGLLFFSYSNKRNLGRVVKYLLTRDGHPFTDDVERYGKALWGHHPRYMEGLVADVGFRIERRIGVGLLGKLVGTLPVLRAISQPPLFLPALAGKLQLSPTQFLFVRKQ